MKRRREREWNLFSLSFLDVLANAIGGLAFLLVIAILMVGGITALQPVITTARLPDAAHQREYAAWLAVGQGAGKFRWTLVGGALPEGLRLDEETGKVSGVAVLPSDQESGKEYRFTVRCDTVRTGSSKPRLGPTQTLSMAVHRQTLLQLKPLRIASTSPLPAAYRGLQFPLVLAAEGGQPPYRWQAETRPPPGLSLGAQGQLEGAPLEPGQYSFRVRVADSAGQQRVRDVALTVSENYPPPPPTPPLKIVTKDVAPAVAGADYVTYLAAEGGSGGYRWSMVQGPDWLQAAADGKSFAGKPAISDVGTSKIVWQVQDGKGTTVKGPPIALAVLPPVLREVRPLAIKTESLPDARVAESYSLSVSVEGGVPPYTWEAKAGGTAGEWSKADAALADSGLRLLTQQALLAGEAARAGEFVLSLAITDSDGARVERTYRLKVRPARQKFQIVTVRGPTSWVGEPFDFCLAATGGFPPYRWEIVEGQLPAGLRLGPDGRVVGQPTQAGDSRIVVTARDAESTETPAVTLDFSTLTQSYARQLVIKTRSLPILRQDQPLELALASEGGVPPYHWELVGAPAGLVVERDKLTGSPTQSGEFPCQLVVRDRSGQQVQASLTVQIVRLVSAWVKWLALVLTVALVALAFLLRHILNARRILPLAVTTKALPHARAAFDYQVQLACLGGSPPYQWRICEGELPPGLELHDDGLLTGKPLDHVPMREPAEYRFTVEVTDRRGATARQPL
jgi:hypothetical protein